VTEGEKIEEKYSLPQSACSADSPLVRGGLGRYAHNRICGGKARHASEENSMSLIGSAGKRP